jgi:hypothetical protein
MELGDKTMIISAVILVKGLNWIVDQWWWINGRNLTMVMVFLPIIISALV